MLKYAKLISEETKQCQVGLGDNTNFYKSLGFEQLDVEQAYDGSWYLSGYCPAKPEPSLEQTLTELEQKYNYLPLKISRTVISFTVPSISLRGTTSPAFLPKRA